MAMTYTYTYTLGSTGRQIVNALNAGKSIIVHVTWEGFETYVTPTEITFSTTENEFNMTVPMGPTFFRFSGGLDDELVATNDSSNNGGIK